MSDEFSDMLSQATDDTIDLDFSEAVEFGQFSAENVLAVVSEAKRGVVKSGDNAGKPKVVWQFTIIEGEHSGRKEFRHTPLTGKGAGLAREIIEATGCEVPDKKGKLRISLSDAVGAEVRITVRPQKKSDDFNEVVRVRPAGDSTDPLGL